MQQPPRRQPDAQRSDLAHGVARGLSRVVFGLLALGLIGCSTTQLPPVSSLGPNFEPLPDELRLWHESRQEEQSLLDEVSTYDDPLLVDYLEGLVGRLTPPGMAANPELTYRVTVLEDPTLNAFAYPHGSIFVHTGLLARMENEAQLATVLGHEMSHVEQRHMLRHRRSARNRQIGLAAASIAAAILVADAQGDAIDDGRYGRAFRIGVLSNIFVDLGLHLAYLASVNGYGRGLELEADQGAFQKLDTHGYDPEQAAAVYRTLRSDRGDVGNLESYFFGSHPKLTARIANAEQWASSHPDVDDDVPDASPDDGAHSHDAHSHDAHRRASHRHANHSHDGLGDMETFNRRIRPVLRDDARLNIEVGRLNLAESQLERALALLPTDPETHFLFARLRLAQAQAAPNDAEWGSLNQSAQGALQETLRLDPMHAPALLELGFLAYDEDDFDAACHLFERYVELAPEAEETPRIRDYVLELDRDGYCGI